MAYIDKILLPGERVVYSASLHWIIYLQGLGITAAGGLLGFYSHPLLGYLFGTELAQQFARPLCGVCGFFALITPGPSISNAQSRAPSVSAT